MYVYTTQQTLMQKIKTVLQYKQTTFLILLTIAIIIPFTVYVASQQQDIRQRAAGGGFKSVDANGCGEAIQTPAQGAIQGDIVWKSPVKAADGTWQTIKQDGTIISQDTMRDKYIGEPRNGGDETSRAQEWDTVVVGPDHINCNTFINITNFDDCQATFQGPGSTDNPLSAGGTTTLNFTVENNQAGGFCRKLIHVVTGGSPSPTPTTLTPAPTDGPTSPTPTSSTPTIPPPTGEANTPTPTGPTSTTAAFTLSLDLNLNGVEANTNKDPLHKLRIAKVSILNANNTPVATASGSITFNAQTNRFSGNIGFSSLLPEEKYLLKVSSPQYLTKRSQIILDYTPTKTSFAIPQITLFAGDSNNDNKLDSFDFNRIYNCYEGKATTQCISRDAVDFDDNGVINGIDYNIFLRNVGNHLGD